MKGKDVLFLSLCLVCLSLHGVAQPQSDKFALAVMRRDGVLVPFAAFDGKRWQSAWPAPQFLLEIPINLQSVPKLWWGGTGVLDAWHLWQSGKTAPRTVRVTQPDWVPAHCARQIALKSDYRSDRPIPPPTEQPYPKDGVATSPLQTLEPIEVMPVAGADALATGLREKFNAAELETDLQFGHPIPRKTREALPPVIEALYAFGDRPRTYYIEASRTYPAALRSSTKGDTDCRVAFATGWFMRDDSAVETRNGKSERAIKWLDMAVDLLPCNKYGATYMLPFGAVRAAARTFWIAQYAGWDHERYVVIELKKNGVQAVVSKWGGGC